ncbi:MAG TPA: type I restriction-modification enzyme R subunit C-terminal domain-containing protein [Pirellulaceae bacterium]|nr:type I restriction-modification enzyme R subunit C-terminal domain-containing protein [Pirellulaceae bacterium]
MGSLALLVGRQLPDDRMTPEERARQNIDRQLTECGWQVQDYRQIDLSAGNGIAVREFPLTSGEADYLLYADGRAIGVVEAKPEGHTLKGIEPQSDKYVKGLPRGLPNYRLPLPFAYESTGTETQFTSILEPDARSRPVFTFHRPEELIRLVQLDDQVRSLLRGMPPLEEGRLWRVQQEAIINLERSLADNRPRSLIQMATGSGKTFTAVNFCYRLIKHAKAKRILFLVDRNNLGKQTLNEFQQFIGPSGYKFTEEYTVQHLKRNTIDAASKVCITTIQRLYSMLQGEDEYLEENEESSLFETETPLVKEPLPVAYNPRIPIETFDFIVVDECHRSIYNLWRQVLEYFDGFLIGLTATPTAQTIGFFNQNLVQEYTHEKAVADGVNVGYDVYRIETQISASGAKLAKEPGIFVPHRDRRTKQKKYRELDDDLTYTANQLDRDVVAEDQIRLVVRTFRDKLPEIFPRRTEVPKTLVFAKTDLHAEDVVRILREEFGKGNDFCQKITAKAHKPDDLLAQFRTAFNPRIAVTVDMIATGTDVKPLECLLFLRNIRSLSYFEQMKGRGCRVIDGDALQSVTPDARHKDHFVIVDAIGVCESEKSATKPLDRQPSVPLDKILNLVGAGAASADIVSTLASRLARLEREIEPDAEAELTAAAGGKDLATLSRDLLASIDPDTVAAQAKTKFTLPAGTEPSEQQLDTIEHERMRQALKPFHNPVLRDKVLKAKQSLEQVIDEQTRDKLLKAGFDAASKEKAQALVTSFRQFIEEHKDEIEALQLLYSRPYRAGLRYAQVKELAKELAQPPHRFDPLRLWQAYKAVAPAKVKADGGNKIVDLIALVRHALDPATPLVPMGQTVHERYEAWLAEQTAAGRKFTPDQRRWLDAIKDHVATSLTIEKEDLDEVPFNQIGGLGKAFELFGEALPALLAELNGRLAA